MVEAENFSVKYQGMTPEQLNYELRQIFGFIPQAAISVEHGSLETYVVNVPDAGRRQEGEVYDVLNKRLAELLNFAPITSEFRRQILRFFWVNYVVVSGVDPKEVDSIVSDDNNIFVPEQAKRIERDAYQEMYRIINRHIGWVVSEGLSTRDREQPRIEGMERWRREFVVCYEEDP